MIGGIFGTITIINIFNNIYISPNIKALKLLAIGEKLFTMLEIVENESDNKVDRLEILL